MAINVGLRLVRDARVSGGRLWIRLETSHPDGLRVTRTLIFERS